MELAPTRGDLAPGLTPVAVGPFTTSYKGRVEFAEVDESLHRARLTAEGQERSGGAAQGSMISSLQTVEEGTEVVVDVSVDGNTTRLPPQRMSTLDCCRLLSIDIVGHTEMMRRLGDAKGREVLREHERITREVLKANGGTEVKTMGDGFMASFGSVVKGVECAIALQKAFDEALTPDPSPVRERGEERIKIRCGLNAGEPIEDEGPDGRSDLFGSTVILAARIAAKAEGGEILASNVVRELCSGKPFLFADRGEHAMKGFDEAVRVFEINWDP